MAGRASREAERRNTILNVKSRLELKEVLGVVYVSRETRNVILTQPGLVGTRGGVQGGRVPLAVVCDVKVKVRPCV